MDGILIASNDTAFYAAFLEAGYLISYDDNGNKIYHRKTIDAAPFPELVIEGQSVRFQPDSPYINLGVDTFDDRVVLLSAYESKNHEGEIVFDLYSRDSGDYLYSFKLKRQPEVLSIISFSMTLNAIYTLELLDTGEYVVRCYYYH